MRCACGYNSFDYNETCPKCHKSLAILRKKLKLTVPATTEHSFFKTINQNLETEDMDSGDMDSEDMEPENYEPDQTEPDENVLVLESADQKRNISTHELKESRDQMVVADDPKTTFTESELPQDTLDDEALILMEVEAPPPSASLQPGKGIETAEPIESLETIEAIEINLDDLTDLIDLSETTPTKPAAVSSPSNASEDGKNVFEGQIDDLDGLLADIKDMDTKL